MITNAITQSVLKTQFPLGCGEDFDYVHKDTIILNSTCAVLYGLALLWALYILVKFLVIQNKCQQKSMIVFYTIVSMDLTTRIIYLIFSCFVQQKANYLLLAAALSTVASVLAGVSHSQNLSRLVFDLSAVKCDTQEKYDKLVRKRYIFHGLLAFWLLVTVIYLGLILEDWYRWASLGETILFSLLGIQLLIIDYVLQKQMNALFSQQTIENSFKHEKRFLISTLVLFSISYLVSVLRNLTIFWMLENEKFGNDNKLHRIYCSSNFDISSFNVSCYVICELVPYLVVFYLNHCNFRQVRKFDDFSQARRV